MTTSICPPPSPFKTGGGAVLSTNATPGLCANLLEGSVLLFDKAPIFLPLSGEVTLLSCPSHEYRVPRHQCLLLKEYYCTTDASERFKK